MKSTVHGGDRVSIESTKRNALQKASVADGYCCVDKQATTEGIFMTNPSQQTNLSLEEIVQRVGLLPFDMHARMQKQCSYFNQADPERRTGRTTRMLCEVVKTASSGKKVYIEAHTRAFAWDLVRRARDYAILCKVNPELINTATDINRRNGVVFVDHFVFELRTTNAPP